MRKFSPAQLKQYLESRDRPPQLVDVREPWEFDYCHIAGSVLIPMGQIAEKAVRLAADEPVVVICHHGIRSRQVAWYLESLGFTDVINLEGGVEQWAQDVELDMRRY